MPIQAQPAPLLSSFLIPMTCGPLLFSLLLLWHAGPVCKASTPNHQITRYRNTSAVNIADVSLEKKNHRFTPATPSPLLPSPSNHHAASPPLVAAVSYCFVSTINGCRSRHLLDYPRRRPSSHAWPINGDALVLFFLFAREPLPFSPTC
jgi:hypothetical protein